MRTQNANEDTRPRLYDLWLQFRFGSDVLAEKAGVSEDAILRMFRCKEVSYEIAVKVLEALSTLVGKEYTLDTVRVNLIQERTNSAKRINFQTGWN